ncbi:phosphatidylserine decarboxylase [Poriferisphaera corsica]|uniref:phosphatidylserine decarboxylase n=1 Tax=Poriferisphaera corsica TaxID=2528020 RepID=UPI0019097244|nr:phosphatidylserine decarboxylase [Poriferisphaera corsica]
MKLSGYGKNEWITAIIISMLLAAASILFDLWYLIIPIFLALAFVINFFRDPDRRIPSQRGIAVAPSDGRITSIHDIESYEPFDNQPATCIRIFMSVFNVHVNRSPCHGRIASITHTPGKHTNTLNPNCCEVNERNLILMKHPTKGHPVAAVRQVAGLLARTICCAVEENAVIQRGQRIGMIKLGSTTELYIPKSLLEKVTVEEGQSVKGGLTVLAQVKAQDNNQPSTPTAAAESHDTSTPETEPAE